MNMSYEFVMVEDAVKHHEEFGADIICNGDAQEIEYE